MKKIIYTVIVIVCFSFVFCCKNRTKTTISIHKQELDDDQQAISSILLNELNDLIQFNDSLKKLGGYSDTNIFLVDFYNEDSSCYVKIMRYHYYDGSKMDGYVIIKDNLIVFNNISECGFDLVYSDNLHKNRIRDFPDENSDKAIHTDFDPIGKRFKIHNKDSLELLYFGFL